MKQQKFLSFVFFETRSPQSIDRTDLGAGSVNICEIYGDVKWWITNGWILHSSGVVGGSVTNGTTPSIKFIFYIN